MDPKAHYSKHCLNCGEHLKGRFCYKCGQDNFDHQESVWHLVKHFFEDITHYDGKLWKTMHPLLTQPGFLTQQFLLGKRVSYLNPIRMFIFLNFIFFFLILSIPSSNSETEKNEISITDNKSVQDTVLKNLYQAETELDKEVKLNDHIKITSTVGYSSIASYDSSQQALPPDKRDGRFRHFLSIKWIAFIHEVKKDPESAKEKAVEIFLHNSPKLSFLFIIICACLLYLLYFRQKQLMINHALFSIHLACTFLLLSVAMLAFTYLPLGNYFVAIIFLYGNYYFYRALRVVYGQLAFKTAKKFLIINFFLIIGMSLGLLLNLFFTMMTLKA